MKVITNTLYYLITLIVLASTALFKNFPLLDDYSFSYINGAFNHIYRPDIHDFYSFFIRYTSLGISIWLTIFVQLSITVYLINQLLKACSIRSKVWLIIVAFFCILLSGLDYYLVMLSPYIFSAFATISLLLLITNKNSVSTVDMIIFFISCLLMPLSGIVLTISLLLILGLNFALKKSNSKFNLRGIGIAIILVLLSSAMLISYHNSKYGQLSLVKNANIYRFSKIAEDRIVYDYLNANCSDYKFQEFCSKQAYFDPLSYKDYLYAQSSPIYSGKCFESNWDECWYEKNENYGSLIKQIFKDNQFVRRYISSILSSTLSQLFNFDQHQLYSFEIKNLLEHHFLVDHMLFNKSDNKTYKLESLVEAISLVLSILVILFFRRFISKSAFFLLKLITIVIITQSFVYAFVYNAHSHTIGVLIPVFILIFLIGVLKNVFNKSLAKF